MSCKIFFALNDTFCYPLFLFFYVLQTTLTLLPVENGKETIITTANNRECKLKDQISGVLVPIKGGQANVGIVSASYSLLAQMNKVFKKP